MQNVTVPPMYVRAMKHDDTLGIRQDPVARDLLDTHEVVRLAYTAIDGSPRVIPVGYVWRPPHFVIGSAPNAAKVKALRRDPRVALTIDTDGFPPKALLVRGTADLELVAGVPEEYLETSRKRATPEQYEQWASGVQMLFQKMVLIRITPTWAKVLDFETRIPSAIHELVEQAQAGS